MVTIRINIQCLNPTTPNDTPRNLFRINISVRASSSHHHKGNLSPLNNDNNNLDQATMDNTLPETPLGKPLWAVFSSILLSRSSIQDHNNHNL
jgi:hypothetical protein